MGSIPPVAVEIGFGSGLTTVSPTWTNVVSAHAPIMPPLKMDMKRGRTDQLDSPQPGSASTLLDNRDGRYTPPGVSGPYVGLISAMMPIRFSATYLGVTYQLWRGWTNGLPHSWESNGNWTQVNIGCVDVLSVLGNDEIRTVAVEEISLDSPSALYLLNESNAALSIADQAQGRGGRLEYTGASGGGYNSASGSILADGVNSALTLTGNATFDGGYRVNIADTTSGQLLDGNHVFTIEATFELPSLDDVPQSGGTLFDGVFWPTNNTIGNGLRFDVAPTGSSLTTHLSYINDTPSTFAEIGFSAPRLVSGVPHHALITWDGNTLTLYIDGIPVGTGARGSMDFTSLRTRSLAIGGGSVGGKTTPFSGTVCNVAVYPTVLSTPRIISHAAAALSAMVGDTSGARLARLLSYGGHVVPTSIASGVSVLSGATTINGQTKLAAAQDIASWENGEVFAAADGTLRFTARTARYNQDPKFVFGERDTSTGATYPADTLYPSDTLYPDDGGGELPYSSLGIGFDTTQVYNDVEITRVGGGTAIAADTNGSQAQYGRQSKSLTYGVASDEEVRGAAQYIYGRFWEPHFRIDSITLEPSSNARLWPACLSLEIGDQITINRRPTGGVPILGDYVIESIAHSIDPKAGTWVTTFELSPADVNMYWQIDDPVFGQIDNPSIVLTY